MLLLQILRMMEVATKFEFQLTGLDWRTLARYWQKGYEFRYNLQKPGKEQEDLKLIAGQIFGLKSYEKRITTKLHPMLIKSGYDTDLLAVLVVMLPKR